MLLLLSNSEKFDAVSLLFLASEFQLEMVGEDCFWDRSKSFFASESAL